MGRCMYLLGTTCVPIMRSDLRTIVFKSDRVVLKSDPMVGPEVVSGKYMHGLILFSLIEKEGETIKNWALQLLYT